MSTKVLVICGDQYHAAQDVMSGMALAGKSSFEFVQVAGLPVDLIPFEFDAMVIAKLNVVSPTDPSLWTDLATDELIRSFVASGKGLLVIHAGTVGYKSAPGIRMLTGGAFQHHPEACEVEFVPTPHPVTAGIGSFTVMDEHYFVETDNGIDVFLTSNSSHGSQPAGWTHLVGKGKICVLTPGHNPHVWQHETFQRLLRNALQWVATPQGVASE